VRRSIEKNSNRAHRLSVDDTGQHVPASTHAGDEWQSNQEVIDLQKRTGATPGVSTPNTRPMAPTVARR